MHPELFSLPFLNIAIPSYGAMLGLGFLTALWVARRRSRQAGENPDHITNFATVALVAGIIGARLMYVLHDWSYFLENPKEVFAVWSGGLEFLGGVIGALLVMILYWRAKKLNVLKFLDILAPALMLGLAFGRMGCFLNGCCFGGLCELPWAIRFPAVNHVTQRGIGCDRSSTYRYSYPFDYQLVGDPQRRPGEPALLQLPSNYYGFTDGKGNWLRNSANIPTDADYFAAPLPPPLLDDMEVAALKDGLYPMRPIHPAQLYSCLNAILICLILSFAFRRRRYDGQVFAAMVVLYGITRFFLEMLRTDSPLEFDGLTISQNLSLVAVPVGIIMFALVRRFRPAVASARGGRPNRSSRRRGKSQ